MTASKYVKPAKTTYAPRCLVAVACQSKVVQRSRGGGAAEHAWAHGAATMSRWRYGRWSAPVSATFETGPQLIEWVESQAREGQPAWVVAPLASYVLTLSGFFERWERLGVKWARARGLAPEGATTPSPDRHSASPPPLAPGSHPDESGSASGRYIVQTLITRGNPDILRYQIGDRRLTWVSGSQFYTASEDAIHSMLIGRRYVPGDTGTRADRAPRDPAGRAGMWLHAMQRLCDWWRAVDGGPWAATMGGLALNYFRHRLDAKRLLSHQEPLARELEERALFGGRAQTYFLGTVGELPDPKDDPSRPPKPSELGFEDGPLEHWDVASMYPTILATQDFPERIIAVRDQPSMARLEDELIDRCVIADCTVETETADYPFREDGRVIWPVGRFRAVLVGPELKRAVAAGHVAELHRTVSYRAGRPFAAAAESLLKLRQEAKVVGDTCWETLVKGLSNSFGGKLAQIKYDWIPRGDVAPLLSWGEWESCPDDPASWARYRAAAGLVWSRKDHAHKGRPLASCFDFLTAYGRDLLHRIMQAISPRRVVSVDTDGLWVLRPTAYQWKRARKVCADAGFILRRTSSAAAGVWFGPRHYWTSAGWILAGYHEPLRVGPGLTFRDYQTHIPRAELCDGPPKTVHVHRRVTMLSSLADTAGIDADGWTRPPRLTRQLAEPDTPGPSTPQAGPPLP